MDVVFLGELWSLRILPLLIAPSVCSVNMRDRPAGLNGEVGGDCCCWLLSGLLGGLPGGGSVHMDVK